MADTPRYNDRPNSTDYQHPQERNLLDLHYSMQYNTLGQPVIRTHVDGITLEGNVLVSNVTVDSGNITVWQGTTPWIIEGNANITSNISGITTLPAINGNVGLIGNLLAVTTLPAITGNVGVSGNVSITQLPAISGNVNIDNFPSNVKITQMPGVTGNVHIWGNIGGSDIPITVNQGTSPWISNTTITGTANVAFPPGATSLLGELYSAVITPTNAVDAMHGLDTEEMQTYIGGGGNVTTANNVFECSTTSTVGSYAVARTKHFNPFRPGESMIGRWLTKFDTPQADTSQRIGLNNQEQGYYIGYNGTTFGILRVHGGKTPVYRVTVTSYTGAQTVTLTLNSVAYTINVAAGETTGQVAQQICLADFGGNWLCNQRDNTVEFLYAGAPGPLNGTFSITSSRTMVASVATVTTGVAATNTWYLDGGVEGFVKPSWLTPTNYCSYAIKYLWAITAFYAVNFNTGQYEQIFRIGTTSDLPVENPTFKAATVAFNTGGSVPVTTKTAAMFTAVEGVEQLVTTTRSAAVTQSTLAQNVLHHIMSIQNPYTFNGEINTRQVNALDLTVSFQCNDPSQIYIYMDAPLATGVHDFVSQDGRLATISTAVGTVSDGPTYFPLLSFIVGTTGTTTQFNLTTYRFVIPPGSTMTLAAYSTASINKASASMTWHNV